MPEMETLAKGTDHANEPIRSANFSVKDEKVSIWQPQTTRSNWSVLHEQDDPVDLHKM
jgi:hypothetical protein